MAYIIGVLEVELRIPLCKSLKEKRSVLRRLENHIRKTFNVSVSEIDDQDAWQTAVLGVVTGSTDKDLVDQMLHKVVGLMDKENTVEVVHFEVEIL